MSWLEQSFVFEWDPVSPFPVPITAQCETIRITWARSFATGPDPFKPYTLVIYTSNYITPFVIDAGDGPTFDFTVPFAPGTRYMVCMFDKNGNTGGCQDVYTVYAASSATPTCKNLTIPDRALTVEQTTSQYGWIPMCSDLKYNLKGGTAPFTLTIAPALQPPYNTTFNSIGEFSWNVALGQATPFFISVVDATGVAWTNGLLHAAASSDTSCLAKSATTKGIPVAGTAGAAAGAFVLGALLACLIGYLFKRRRSSSNKSEAAGDTHTPYELNLGQREVYPAPVPVAHMASSPNPHHNPPYDPRYSTAEGTVDYGRSTYYENQPNMHAGRSPSPPGSRHPDTFSEAGGAPPSSIFIMHHDGGAAPVTLFGPAGERLPMQELPPSYVGGGSSNGATSVSGREGEGRPLGAMPPDVSSYLGGGGRSVSGTPDWKGGNLQPAYPR